MNKSCVIFIGVFAVISAYGEFRIWTDQKGNTLEAEFSGTIGKNIILKKQDGKTLELSPMLLSADDQEYLYGKIPDLLFDPSKSALDVEKPPRLGIDFKKVTDTENNLNTSSYRTIDMYSCVTITKQSREPYSREMKAEVYVIGICDRANQFVLLDKATHDFSFDETERESRFETGHIILREYRYDTNYSTEYEGFLVVIKDDEGNVLTMQSSSSKFEENYEHLLNFKKGTFFTKRYDVDHVAYGGKYY